MPEASRGALEGLKVIDLSRVLGGPYCGQMLADHGADVIKVEPPQGDETRTWGPPFDKEGISAYFAGINRNKRTIALDLSKPEGRDVLMKLLETADVLIDNFKTGTMEKWGIGYADTLSKKFPRLVHARVSGFGADGPLGAFRATTRWCRPRPASSRSTARPKAARSASACPWSISRPA
jgi:crotonobetainyl-CoA:carnitine CoA-transferase CaiB-like acyl-CoA transferase